MAESTFKRVLTDDIQAATRARDEAAAASGTPDDIYLKLRNVGARARKNVLEGYRTAPSSFSRAQTTGSLFRPMNDILRDVYTQPLVSASTSSQTNTTTRKRARSVSERDEATEDATCVKDSSNTVVPPAESVTDPSRPMRPLRTSSRAFLQTRSLPASAFAFSTPGQNAQQLSTIPPLEEEDWSEQPSAFTSQSTLEFEPAEFEPMAFE
ncbi:hypothetical protein D9619_001141 [Psilocybe cf. subviscida]|uniref:Uncharacterized protein n=1 Tax=Psilocybe cf. subviscida TaxID=2480587 RepID=A0A8H5F417_9AGAR|nr:hypothetical protein D9619_001141 [Psilocybe cf. subviscida]